MALDFTIAGRHVEVTPALQDYALSKLSKIERVIANRASTIHVILSVEKLEQKAEAELKIAGDKNVIFAEATTTDMYESIDKLEDKLYAQVLKFHGKLTDHDHHKE